MSRNKEPLWSRVLQDPECKEFIRKHKDEFRKESFVPQPIAFPEWGIPSSFIADVIEEAMPFDNPEHQMLAGLYLVISARRIATKLNWPRRKVYVRLRNLKRIAIRRWKAKRRELLGAREETRDLDTQPELIAIKDRSFTFLGKTKNAYLIQLDGEQLSWVDGVGKAFTPEVQEILNNLGEHAEEFEHVEIDS